MATTDKPEDVEVRLADQEKINEFGRLNNRLLDIIQIQIFIYIFDQ